MPVFSVLAATAEICVCINSAVLEPEMKPSGECWSAADVEATVSGKNSGIAAIKLCPHFADDEHGNFRPVLGRIENLFNVIGVAVHGSGDLCPFSALAGCDLVTVD